MSNVYRVQLFTLLAISAMLIFQYELLMADRGVSLTVSLMVFSISQVAIMLTSLGLSKYADRVKDKNIIIQVSVVVRTVVMGLMYLTQTSWLFILLFLTYQLAAAINILFEGMLAQWSFDKRVNFGSIRLVGSIGFSVSGFIASFIYVTGGINHLLLIIFLVNLLNLIGVFKFPIEVEKSGKATEGEKLDKKYKFLILLGAFIMVQPNSFAVVLNNYYRVTFGLTVEQAMIFAGIAVLLGSFLSEVAAFVFVNKLISKLGAYKIILVGMLVSCLRWSLAFLAPSPELFALTYLLHGITFAFVYIGIVTYIKDKVGNNATSKLVIILVVYISLLGFMATQIINLAVNLFGLTIIILGYTIISVITTIVYRQFYREKKVEPI